MACALTSYYEPMVAAPISIAMAARPSYANAAGLSFDPTLTKEESDLLRSNDRVPTRTDVVPSAKRLDPKALDLFLFTSVAMKWSGRVPPIFGTR